METEVIDLDAHREVWVTCKLACRACPETCFSCVHLEADWDRLECPGCHEMTGAVTHVDVAPDAEDYDWRPRLQGVR